MNILNKLTIKHLKMNKKRTIVTIVGVILSTALMVGIGLIFSTIRDNSIKEIIASEGSQHLIAHIKNNQKSIIESDKNIKKYDYINDVGVAKIEDKDEKWSSDLKYHILSLKDFSDFKLAKGELPKNSGEVIIDKRLSNWIDKEIQVGDTLDLDVGVLSSNGKIVFNDYGNSKIINTKKMTFKVVGIYSNEYDYGLTIYTKNMDSEYVIANITFKDIKKTYENTSSLGLDLGFENVCNPGVPVCFSELDTNDSLLSMYGISKYNNIEDSMSRIIIIILSLISIGCIIVIYNSFAISVMERKKQFGLFSSIGATRKQLRKTVFFEAFIVGIIGIPLGILGGIFGIWVVINIVNNLLSEVFTYPLALAIYPMFMYIPVIFMIITIFASALIPSYMASRVSPITAIRQNDDIKIKNKKIKTPKFIRKLFGVEGELALKNMKRNKKKYRVTIISLFISIVLFVSFSGFADYGIKTMYRYTEMPTFDIEVNLREDSKRVDFDKIVSDIVSNEDVTKYTVAETQYLYLKEIDKSHFDEKYYQRTYENNDIKIYDKEEENYTPIIMNVIDDASYNEYKRNVGIKENHPILINIFNKIEYDDYDRISKTYKILKDTNFDFHLYKLRIDNYSDENETNVSYIDTNVKLDNIYLTDIVPFGFENSSNGIITLVISESMSNKLNLSNSFEERSRTIFIKANPYKNIDKLLTDLKDEDKDYYFNYYNVTKEMKMLSNAILAIRILLYGFIGLVTLIGVTSVFNTINTSIALRRREFSMLRSVGLTPKGFNKILYFESFFFGLKSLLYAIPISIFVVYLLHKSFGTMVEFGTLIIPWLSILEAVIGVFIIVLISMLYASSKIKKENILEALREENI